MDGHERRTLHKERLIKLLDNDLGEAEEQHQIGLQTHLANVSNLIEIQVARIERLQHSFEGNVTILETEFMLEK